MDYFNNAPLNFNPLPEEEEQVKADRERALAEQKAMEEQKKLEQQNQAKQQQAAQQEAQPKPNSLVERTKENVIIGATPALGIADFIADAVGMVPWLKGADEWWDKNSPRSKNPLVNGAREVASVAIPTFLGSRFTIGKLGSATAGSAIPKSVRLLGSVAAAAGVDTAVTYVSSTSEEDNAAGQLNKWLGGNYLPWGTLPEDSPDVKRQKNMMEAAGLSVGADLLSAVFALRKGLKLIPTDDESAVIIKANEDLGQGSKLADSKGNPVPSENDIDPITSAIENRQASRQEQLIKEGEDILNTDPNGGFNPKLNTELADPEGIPMTGVGANAVQAKVDNFLIQRNQNTLDGQMTPPYTREFERVFQGVSGDKAERARLLLQLSETLQPNANLVSDSARVNAAAVNKSWDILTDQLMSPAVSFDDFKQIVDNTKQNVYQGVNLLGEAENYVAVKAIRSAFETLDPMRIRASAAIAQSSANDATNLAWAVRNIGDYADTTEHQKLFWDKVGLLYGEVRANQRVAGIALQLKKLVSKGSSWDEIGTFMTQADQAFAESISKTTQEAAQRVANLKAIAEKNPEMFKAILPVFEATNGKIDDMAKLFRFAENYVGVLGKSVFNMGDPSVESAFVKGIQQTRYNNILLSASSFMGAALGNAINTILKPTTTLFGSIGRDSQTYKRALWGYGGVSENIKRAYKAMSDEWAVIRRSPENAPMGRPDDPEEALQYIESMDAVASKWMEKGDIGRVAAWNLTKGMAAYNGNSFVRLGTDSLKALDVFVRSISQAGSARFRAYDDLLMNGGDKMSKAEFTKAFEVKQNELYNQAFDETGLLRKPFGEADFASKEMTLSLDNELVSRLDSLMQQVPAAKTLFMFPRTGLNALEMAWSYTPMSALGGSIGRVRKTLKATTPEEISEVLMEHGYKPNEMPDPDLAFAAIKAEYIGRQIVGGAVTTLAGLWALEGNLTGNGPQDAAQRRRLINMGWKPLSIRSPFDGKWYSYQGLEPFSSTLGLVSDAVFHATRVDQAVTEDLFKKISFAVSANVSNKTFLSGFQVLTDLLSGDEAAWNRFFAMQVDTAIPFSGLRSTLSKVITPQLKDVENDFVSYLANRNKFLFSSNDELQDMLDVYTGKPINYWEPFTAAGNAFLPFFKTNGGTEPWREWLIKSGWSGLQNVTQNPITGGQITPEQRQWVNNWVAKNGRLAEQIEAMRTQPDGFWDKQIKEYVKRRGSQTQEQYPIKEIVTHEMLNRIHHDAWTAGWNAYAAENQEALNAGEMAKQRNRQLNIGDQQGASETQRQLDILLAYPK